MTTYRSIHQPLIFNTGAVREELKEGLQNYLFLTCWLREREGQAQQGLEPELLRAGVDIRPCKNTGQRQIEVINFRDLAEQPDSKMVGFPCASLTYCVGLYEDKGSQRTASGKQPELCYFRKLAEVTLGEITGASYKLLQLYMQDLLLNLTGLGDAERGDGLCQLLKL